MVRHFLRNLFHDSAESESLVPLINNRRAELSALSDAELKAIEWRRLDLPDVIALVAVIAERVLGLKMFDVQLEGALALTAGKIAEMQTGEGKTLAAVPAVVWHAREAAGVHVMTVNDYLARRDAQWMGGIYEFLGLTVSHVQQGMDLEERRQAYACDVTYATANEIGFDHLRDGLALSPGEQVHRPLATAVIDEADSILIDEARIPLVIAGGEGHEQPLAYQVDRVTRFFRRGRHFTLDEYGRNIALTDAGIHAIEASFGCGNLFTEWNLPLLTAVQDSLHSHALLRRDVDYLVKDGVVESVDEFKGRIAENRRWPAGLHTAIEAKEGLALKTQGRILGSITLQNLISLYPTVCGMTGTAATQADEFRLVSELGWGFMAGGKEPSEIGMAEFRNIVYHDANWDWRTFDFDKGIALAEKVDNNTITANDPNLKPFFSHGGKLLMYHGWTDPLIAPENSINYYTSVLDKMGGASKAGDSIRLFMVPGMDHCGGGEGPNAFDSVSVMEQWVEKGVAPSQIVASHRSAGKVDRTRPLCTYPQVAHYKGSGSIDEASNFVCSSQQ